MTDDPLSISEWKQLSEEDPAGAARVWLQRVDAIDASLRSTVLAQLPTQAALIEAWEQASQGGGPLAGVPFLAKDLFDAAGWETTASSVFLPEVRPGPHSDSRAVAALKKRGAVLAGKTHLNEFAYGLSGENPHFGDCPHPQAPTLLSGGSSSGSAWAVGAGLVPFALGTDTGGSIRVPASFCALFGMRLTPRHVWTREGCFPLAPSFDAAGWFTRSAVDMDFLLKTLLPPSKRSEDRAPRGLWLGDPTGKIDERYLTAMYRHADALAVKRDPEEAAAFTESIKEAPFSFAVLQSTEAMSVHADWVGPYAERYDPLVLQRLRRAEGWTPEDYARAVAIREKARAAFAAVFAHYDFAVMPAVPTPAQPKHEMTAEFRERLLALNVPVSLAGLPVLTIPLFLDAVQSLGIQVIFPRIDRRTIAAVLARVT